MVQDTVMLNAHMILSSKKEKPMLMDGHRLQLTLMQALVSGVHAVPKWIFGKPTRFQKLSLLIHAKTWDTQDVLIQ